MGFQLTRQGFDAVLAALSENYALYAPRRYQGGATFSDMDCIRYGEIQCAEEIVFDQKSDYSFKEVLLPVAQTLFYFTEDRTEEAAPARKKGAVIFLRSCDLHALRRLDDMYLHNRPEDYYYKQLRDNTRFVLMGCSASFDNCFCASMGTNQSDAYDMSIDPVGDSFVMDCKNAEFEALLRVNAIAERTVMPQYVSENPVTVAIPENLSSRVAASALWHDYDSRCIGCGRCNFACPTCTCFTMQDIFYTDNGSVGERRRVQASCMVDGFTDVAGGGSYRQKYGARMRFKVMHKVYDYAKRNGYHMCVGCGRCDDICPEYISFSAAVNRLSDAMEEVENNG